MLKGFFNVPKAVNEPVKSYAPNSPERAKVAETYTKMWNSQVEVPLYIGSEEIKTGNTKKYVGSTRPPTYCRCLSSSRQSLS
jgi:1-pyrroline-5-carboxylate dehydrogenase